MLKISPSQVKLFLKCPYAYYLRYVKKVYPTDIPDYITKGENIHEIIFSEKDNPLSPVAKETWNRIKKYVDPSKLIIEPNLEKLFKDNIILIGIPDLVSTSIILDIKTTQNPNWMNIATKPDKLQMEFYSMLTGIKELYIVKVFYCDYHNEATIIKVNSDKNLHNLIKDSLYEIKKILNSEIEPKPKHTDYCSRCMWKSACPIGREQS